MVEHVLTIEDPVRRQQQAMVAIELMGTLNPHLINNKLQVFAKMRIFWMP